MPAAFFGTLFVLFVAVGRDGLRQSFLHAATVYTLCLVFVTEALSIWNLLRLPALLAFWTACALFAAGCLLRWGDRRTTMQTLSRALVACRTARLELLAVAAILAAVLLVALVAPPNNWESMNYRLTRVVMWMQQGSVAHYPSPDAIQLFFPPLSEYNILNFQILSGGDRFTNMDHWFALAGCGILASLIAKGLRQPFPVQVLAAVIAVTLPMGIVHGSSTQGNLPVAFWLLAFTVFVLRYFTRPSTVRLVCCGLAFGFALLSKGTTYWIGSPLAATLFLCAIVRTRGWRPRLRLAAAGVVTLMVALSVNGGLYWRNWDLFGHPMYSNLDAHSAVNSEFFEPSASGVRALTSGLIRNAALHWGVPSEGANRFTLDVLRRVTGDRLLSVPEATRGTPSFLDSGIPFSLGEYRTGNFVHFWFLSASLAGILLFRKRLRFDPWVVCLALAVALSAVFFCGAVRWEQWNARYHLPLFMLGAPLAAAFAARLLSARAAGAGSGRSAHAGRGAGGVRRLATVFAALSIPWVVSNDSRPFYPPAWIWQSGPVSSSPSIFVRDRAHMYFNAYPPNIFSSYDRALDALAALNPTEVGILFGERWAYYPIWALLNDKMDVVPRLGFVGVDNDSSVFGAGFAPSTILDVGTRRLPEYRPPGFDENESADVVRIGDSIFFPVHSAESITVLQQGHGRSP